MARIEKKGTDGCFRSTMGNAYIALSGSHTVSILLSMSKFTTLFLFVLFFVFSALDVKAQSEATWPSDAWPVSTPEAEGIDPSVIDAITGDIAHGRYGLIDHFLVIKNGKVVTDFRLKQDYESIAEDYDTTNYQYNYDSPEWHPYYKDTDLHTLQSLTKSITSAALGIAVDEGLIDGVDVPAMEMFDEYKQDFDDPLRKSASLEDLLTMRSGIEWNEMTSYTDSTNSCILMEASENWIQYILDQPMREEPGTVFDYNSGVSVLLGKVIQLKTGKRADEWTEEKLFKPIGIDEYYWKKTPKGEVDTEGGLYLSAYDLARIGYLFMNAGRWEDKQIISEEWVKASTAPVVEDIRPDNDRPDTGYGYQWWVPSKEQTGAEVFAGNGYGGQFLQVVPEHDLIVVFNGWNIHERTQLSSWSALRDRILPAVKAEG